MRKILFVHKVPSGYFGNADSQYMPITLVQMGFDVAMVALAGGDASLLRNAGVRVCELGDGKTWFDGLFETVRATEPDIVHVFIHAGCGLYPIIMKANSNPRFILDIRSPSLRTGITRQAIQIKNRLEPLFFNAITAQTYETAWTLISKRHKVHLVPTGVELDRIPTHSRTSNNSGPLRLIYIGSLRRLRKVPEMIKAVLIAGKSVPLHLDIYGDGEDLGTIEVMIHQHQAEEWIHLKPIVPRNDLLQRLGLYDIGLSYVPKALYDPAPPLKTIEYLASGITAVATNTRGNELLVNHQENGILAAEDPLAFAEGILLAANNPQLRRKFAETARPSVEKYDWKNIVQTQLLPVYERVARAGIE